MSDISSIVGLYFEHLWYMNKKNVLYNWHVVCVKPLQSQKFLNSLWKTDEVDKELDGGGTS